MRGYLTRAIALSLVLASTPVLQADITPVNYPTPMPIGASISGTVTNIDNVNRMIQVKESSGMVQTIRLDTHIQIYRNNQPASLETLSLGDSVTVRSL